MSCGTPRRKPSTRRAGANTSTNGTRWAAITPTTISAVHGPCSPLAAPSGSRSWNFAGEKKLSRNRRATPRGLGHPPPHAARPLMEASEKKSRARFYVLLASAATLALALGLYFSHWFEAAPARPTVHYLPRK